MKKVLIITILISAFGIVLMNLRVNSFPSSIMERDFTHRFGATGYLLNAATYFRNYEFNEKACEKDKKINKKKCRRKKRNKKTKTA